MYARGAFYEYGPEFRSSCRMARTYFIMCISLHKISLIQNANDRVWGIYNNVLSVVAMRCCTLNKLHTYSRSYIILYAHTIHIHKCVTIYYNEMKYI